MSAREVARGLEGAVLLGLLLLPVPPALAQENTAARSDQAARLKNLRVSVRVRGAGTFGRGKKLTIELTMLNGGAEPITLEFRTSGRVCGALYDSKDKAYYEFPQVTAQVLGRETFPPGKKRLFPHEIPRQELRQVPPGTNAVAAWLCGYDALRARGEFQMSFPARE